MKVAVLLVLLAGLTDRMAHAQADCSQSSSYKLNAPGESANPDSITCYGVAGQPLATMSINPAGLQCVCPEGDYTSDCSSCPVLVGTTPSPGRRHLMQAAAPAPSAAAPALSCPSVQLEQGNVPWGLDRINQRALPLDSVYSWTTTGQGINVYVISTGIRATHSDFITNGQSRVRAGYSFDGSDSLSDQMGYGTQVAGIIGGNTYGVAKNVTLYSVKVFSNSPSTNLTQILQAVQWVQSNAVKPAVAVWLTYGAEDPGKTAAVTGLTNAGITVVTGSGSQNSNACNTGPAGVPAAITVGPTAINDSFSNLANFGSCVDLVAPGVDIPGPSALSDNGTWITTSANNAPGFVAGAIARLLQLNSSLSPADLSQALVNTSTTGAISNLKGSPNNLLYTGGYSPACPGYPSSGQQGISVLVGDPVTSCAAAGNLTYNQSLTQALSINFTVYPSNAVDAQTLTPAAFSIPGGQVLSVTPVDSTNVGCGGLLVQAEISQQNAYLYNGTQVCLDVPAGGSVRLASSCSIPFPAVQQCFTIPNCPTACIYGTNMAYSQGVPTTTDSTVLLTLAATEALTGVSPDDFVVTGPTQSSISIVNEPDAPTFYFLIVTLPTDYYGPVEVAWSSAGSATDAQGDQLTPPQPLNFTRTQAEPLASSCVFELISPATQTA